MSLPLAGVIQSSWYLGQISRRTNAWRPPPETNNHELYFFGQRVTKVRPRIVAKLKRELRKLLPVLQKRLSETPFLIYFSILWSKFTSLNLTLSRPGDIFTFVITPGAFGSKQERLHPVCLYFFAPIDANITTFKPKRQEITMVLYVFLWSQA